MTKFLIFAVLLTAHFSLFAQKSAGEVDFSRFVKDIALTKSSTSQIKMAMWMPSVYWKIAAASNPQITPELLKNLVEVIDEYVIVCVVKADMNLETVQFENMPESVLRKKVTLLHDGKSYKPLYYNDLTPDAQQIKDMIEPMFARMLGELGNGMTILYFKVQDANNKSLIDPYKKDAFTLVVDGTNLTYILPLPSLYDDKSCPQDGAEFPANYTYCPFHGIELKKKEDQIPAQDDVPMQEDIRR